MRNKIVLQLPNVAWWLAAMSVVTACRTEKDRRDLYIDQVGDYAVWFPTPPRVPTAAELASVPEASAVTTVLATSSSTEDGITSYGVTYGQTQAPILHSDSLVFSESLFWTTQSAMRDSAQLLDRFVFYTHGYRGVDYTWHSNFRGLNLKDKVVRSRVLLVKNRLYSLTVAGKNLHSSRADQFFSSFRLLNAPVGLPPVIRYKVPGYPNEVIATRHASGAVASTMQVLKGSLEVAEQTVERTYSSSGRMISETHLRRNVRHGSMRQWYSSGVLQSETTYRNDTLTGPTREYYPNGKLEVVWGQSGKMTCYSLEGKVHDDQQYVKSLVRDMVPPWSEEQRAQAQARCMERNASREAPAMYCDCCIGYVQKHLRPADYLALGGLGAETLVDILGAVDCLKF